MFRFSSQGALAVAIAIRHPERYGTMIALSLGEGKEGCGTPERAVDTHRHFLMAGEVEPFRGTTSRWTARLARIGVEHLHRERMGGDDPGMWEEGFLSAVAWPCLEQQDNVSESARWSRRRAHPCRRWI